MAESSNSIAGEVSCARMGPWMARRSTGDFPRGPWNTTKPFIWLSSLLLTHEENSGKSFVGNRRKFIAKASFAGRTGQEYNQRKNRKGAFWDDRYNATAVESGEYLFQCLIYWPQYGACRCSRTSLPMALLWIYRNLKTREEKYSYRLWKAQKITWFWFIWSGDNVSQEMGRGLPGKRKKHQRSKMDKGHCCW